MFRNCSSCILAVVAGVILCHGAVAQLPADQLIDLTPVPPAGVPKSVAISFVLGGQLKLSPAATADRLPIAVDAELQYDAFRSADGSARELRSYRTVNATTEVDGRERTPWLRDDRRNVVVDMRDGQLTFTALGGLLTREEYDILDMPADTLMFDSLLPSRAIKLGETWQLEPEVMRAFTGLDSVGMCEVSAVLAEANEGYAKCQMAGAVHGVLHGASAEFEIDTVLLFDRRRQQITQLNVALRQKRTRGPATPGLEGVAKLRIKIDSLQKQNALTPQLIAEGAKTAGDQPQLLETLNSELGFATQHDTQWYEIGTRGRNSTLRCVATEGLVAHANISQLDAKPLDPSTALAEFRRDVLQSLGQDAHGVAAEQQWISPHGCRVMSVIVTGNVNGSDVEWHAYQVAPPVDSEYLHRLALTFTVEKSELKRLDGRDRELIDHLRLVPCAELEAKRPAVQK